MTAVPDIPGYQIAGVIAKGGFATVYRGWQVAVGREVAVKVDNRVLFSERDRRRFVREVTAAGKLSGHPHVIDVYDAGTVYPSPGSRTAHRSQEAQLTGARACLPGGRSMINLG